ncbi:MAG: cysteine synthase family protein [Clostridia bacterium]|nr:cysteine synthase family protein [Clostridia bacterium]
MALYQSMQELVGNTPLVRLSQVDVPEDVRLYAKLEYFNPGGSVKDRIGQYMIRDAEAQGLLKPGGTIVEGTAGNTGLGIAFAALGRGYRVIFVVPDKFSEEKQTLMRALGAEIVNTPREDGMLGAAAKAEALRESIPGAVALRQFENPYNPLAHYETTGPEIWRDLEGDIDYVVAGAGSGGTFSGVLKYLKEKNPKIVGVLADPVGSTMGGGEHGDYNIEGIGNDFIANTMDMSLVDKVIKINDDEAFSGARELAAKEGILGGSSSGAAYAAAKKLIASGAKGSIVFVTPDRGDRYFSKHLYAGAIDSCDNRLSKKGRSLCLDFPLWPATMQPYRRKAKKGGAKVKYRTEKCMCCMCRCPSSAALSIGVRSHRL